MVAQKTELTSCFINVQADNCTKEIKNNSTLRLMAMWVALHKVAGAELNFLSSGHSHEDIVDALFNLLRSHLDDHKELWAPGAFRDCLPSFFSDSRNRPYEPERHVTLLNQFKDWNLTTTFVSSLFLSFLFVCFSLGSKMHPPQRCQHD